MLYKQYIMKIVFDERETALHEKCSALNITIPIEKRVLTLGDILITDDDDKEILLIERKSLSDLIASIKDSRYEEQSYRLIHASGMCRHHIVYIIEGLFSQLRTPVEKKMVYSAMTTLQVFKGFSVIRTNSLQETADWIANCSDKLNREILRGNQPWTSDIITTDTSAPPAYCTVVKRTKKDNITPENIGEILLCQIPGISSVSAMAIMHKFQTISNLIDNVKLDENCMNDIMCETRGKTRKLGKNIVQNIITYLI